MKTTVQLESRLANRRAQRFTKQKIANAIRILALTLFAFTISSVAHAQGTVDVSGVTAAMGTIEKSCVLGGALAVVIGIVFGVFQFMGRNISGRLYGNWRRSVRRYCHRLRSSVGQLPHRPEHFNGRNARSPGARLIMQMTKRGEPLAINQALNKSRQRLGLSLPIWMGIVIMSLLALLLRYFVLSILIFISITVVCSVIISKHPKMFQLWGLSFTQMSYYDPRKR